MILSQPRPAKPQTRHISKGSTTYRDTLSPAPAGGASVHQETFDTAALALSPPASAASIHKAIENAEKDSVTECGNVGDDSDEKESKSSDSNCAPPHAVPAAASYQSTAPSLLSVEDTNIITNLPNQRKNIVSKKGARFTLMVAGESGLGKTTFINTLFHDDLRDTSRRKQLFPQSSSDGHVGYYNKTTNLQIIEAEYQENGFKMAFTVIDTPGFGDFTNNNNSWVPIINFVDQQHRYYMIGEEQQERGPLLDTRVHACLYFIRPSGHGLLDLDVRAMRELSTRVNLIPVLAKADSFTYEDREYFKEQVRAAIDDNGIQVYTPSDGYGDDTNGGEMDAMPFAVISSESVVTNRRGAQVRGRKYQWGVAEVDNEQHCDFAKLRRVLMSTYMLDLVDTTVDKHYEKFRRQAIAQRLAHAKCEQQRPVAAGEGSDAGEPLTPPLSVAELQDMAGLQVLRTISNYGMGYLQDKVLDQDPIFLDKKNKINERFDAIIGFQERKFEQWRAELKQKQDEYNQELQQLHNEINELGQEVDTLSKANAPGHRRNFNNGSGSLHRQHHGHNQESGEGNENSGGRSVGKSKTRVSKWST